MSYRLCRHIKTNGLQCQSPAMRDQPFCYHHHIYRHRNRFSRPNQFGEVMQPVWDSRTQSLAMAPVAGNPVTSNMDFGLLEDAQSVQVAISSVVNALAGNRLDMRRATALLYGLQLAASNCRASAALEPKAKHRPHMLRHPLTEQGEFIAEPGLHQGEVWDEAEDRENEDQEDEVVENPSENSLDLQSRPQPNPAHPDLTSTEAGTCAQPKQNEQLGRP